MNILTALSFLVLLPAEIVSNDQSAHFFDSANLFFESVVDDAGMVDYAGIRTHPELLDQLVDQIAAFDYTNTTKDTQKAFLINSYNILVIKGIVERYPVKSPMNIKRFFDTKAYTVAGKTTSLNDLEKGWLFHSFPDARLHFVLVCAAISCPPLANHAYTSVDIDQQLDNRTRRVFTDKSFVQSKNGRVMVSEIFNWYANDFKKTGTPVDYINQFLDKPYAPGTKYGYYTYNWDLNDQTYP